MNASIISQRPILSDFVRHRPTHIQPHTFAQSIKNLRVTLIVNAEWLKQR